MFFFYVQILMSVQKTWMSVINTATISRDHIPVAVTQVITYLLEMDTNAKVHTSKMLKGFKYVLRNDISMAADIVMSGMSSF